MKRRHWTAEDEQLLRELYPDTRTADLAQRFGRALRAIYTKAKDMGLRKSPEYLASPAACRLRRGDDVGAATRFSPGQQAWNKGKEYKAARHPNCVAHQFKPGQLSGRAAQLVLPVGTYRISSDGYLERKVGTTPGSPSRRWKGVHRLLWEEAHGPVPEGYLVVFKPGMRTTVLQEITLDRLELLTRRENLERNSVHKYGPELARISQLRGALTRQINKRAKE